MTYAELTTWMIDHFGFDGFIKVKGLIILLTGVMLGGLAMMWHSAFVMKSVRPNENLEKVSILVVDGTIFTSPPKTILESIEKRFFIFLYKTHIFRKSIEFHNKKRMKFLFLTYLTVMILIAVVGVYLSVTLAFTVDNQVVTDSAKKSFMYRLERVTDMNQ